MKKREESDTDGIRAAGSFLVIADRTVSSSGEIPAELPSKEISQHASIVRPKPNTAACNHRQTTEAMRRCRNGVDGWPEYCAGTSGIGREYLLENPACQS
jgi:hypothetical protein